jgi:hypothetical protein
MASLTSGGSMANLIALLIASRKTSGTDAARKGLWNSGPPMTVYASSEVHMSIAKAADILGFGRDQVRSVRCDDRLRLDMRALRESIESDLRAGLRPFCIVGNAARLIPERLTHSKISRLFHVSSISGFTSMVLTVQPGVFGSTKEAFVCGSGAS